VKRIGKLTLVLLTLTNVAPSLSAQQRRRPAPRRVATAPQRLVQVNRYEALRGLPGYADAHDKYYERVDKANRKYEERQDKAAQRRRNDYRDAERERRDDLRDAERDFRRNNDRDARWEYEEDLSKADRDYRRDLARAEERFQERNTKSERELRKDLDKAEEKLAEKLRGIARRNDRRRRGD
jgi:hypothetical protein